MCWGNRGSFQVLLCHFNALWHGWLLSLCVAIRIQPRWMLQGEKMVLFFQNVNITEAFILCHTDRLCVSIGWYHRTLKTWERKSQEASALELQTPEEGWVQERWPCPTEAQASLVIQCQMVSPENINTIWIIQTKHVTFRNIYAYTYTYPHMYAITVREIWGHESEGEWEGYTGRFWGGKRKGEMLWLHYNLREKTKHTWNKWIYKKKISSGFVYWIMDGGVPQSQTDPAQNSSCLRRTNSNTAQISPQSRKERSTSNFLQSHWNQIATHTTQIITQQREKGSERGDKREWSAHLPDEVRCKNSPLNAWKLPWLVLHQHDTS